MTRTEAAEILDNLIGMVEDNQENDYDTALKMAIEALKADGDTISRQAALELKVSHGINEDGRLFIPYGEVKRYLENLPPAQPEIVRCKDCQFFDPTDVPSTAFPNMKRCGWLKIVMTEDGYCSYGRRKELKGDPSHPFADDVMMEN